MIDATDCHLLERFVTNRDEAAFSILTRRHAARVRGVCRRVLQDEHEAEDILQTTFLVLARKAVVLHCQPSVGPWLSAVAHRLALHARAIRYRSRERPAGLLLGSGEEGIEPALPDGNPVAAVAQMELSSLVREELAALPEKYRVPVTLCYLEGKTNEQAARELGWPTGSMSRRLEKARRLLRERLTGRGLALVIFLLSLGIAASWLARSVAPVSRCPDTVAEAMSRFKPKPLNQPGLEELLRQLGQDKAANINREQVAVLAAEATRASEKIENLDPGRRREDWQRLAREMGLAARELAVTAKANDRPATLVAAARLHTTCVRCHETFRD